jgi:indolepyruvate ferredoxin oxidoreductase
MDAVQRELREVAGTTVLIYDQTCAAEKRRRRKKGQYHDLPKRLLINEAVCEGCGDCGVQSNCTSLLPVETELGRKRQIDQSSCNKDYSCVNGFCPSFVTVLGGQLKKPKPVDVGARANTASFSHLPTPELPPLNHPFNILITGIGGTGVITIGALMGMAAHLEGKGASVLDMTGMSQKNGAVTSHVRLAAHPDMIRAQRIATGEADLLLGCDMLAAGSHDAISKTRPGRTRAVINTHEQPTGQFAKSPDWQFPQESVRGLINEAVTNAAEFVDATRIATALLGDSIAANLFMLGFAWQRGRVPLKETSLMQAIALNGVAVKANQQAFLWGRRAAVDLNAVIDLASPAQPVVLTLPQSTDALIRRRVALLAEYQNAAYAQRYESFIDDIKAKLARENLGKEGDKVLRAVAQNLYKLMAYKDEYEVARLYTDRKFQDQLNNAFEGPIRLRFNLAPPWLAKKNAQGHLVKEEYGAWVFQAFKLLAKLKGLRGTAWDVFGYHPERKMERGLVDWYRQSVTQALQRCDKCPTDTVLAIAKLPEQIRGFGHVKVASVEKAKAQLAALQSIGLDTPVKEQAA